MQEKENKRRAQIALRVSISDVGGRQECLCVELVPAEYRPHDAEASI